MAQWVQARLAFFVEVDRPRRRRGGSWEGMVREVMALCASIEGEEEGEEEKCVVCEGKVPIDPMMNLTVACENGHVLGRCMETFTLIKTPEYWECPLCSIMACPSYSGEREGGGVMGREGWLRRPAWLRPWHGRGMMCLYCNVPCQLVNT